MRSVGKSCSAFAALALAAFVTGAATAADPGVSADKVVFGQAAVFEGPASALGLGMREGIQAAFAEVNKTGGIKGRKLELVAVDDGYEPNKSIEAVNKLIGESKVFSLIGAVGTPTAAATLPIATKAEVPVIGFFTGAEALRTPHNPHAVHIRASYFQETEVMVEELTKAKGFSKIAILFQDDGFGRAGLEGINRALAKRNMKLVAEGSFERNTVAVKNALLEIRKGDPEAVVIIGPYKPAAEFIKLARQVKMNATFVNISFVGSDALAAELGAGGAGVVVTQVVPFPQDTSLALVKRYHEALKASNPSATPGFISLEGYMTGRVAIAALGKIDGEPTRKALIEAVGKLGAVDLGGMTLNYAAGNHQGSSQVYLTAIGADGKFVALKSLKELTN